jgi:hypothetical protein
MPAFAQPPVDPSSSEDSADLVLRHGRFHTVSPAGTVVGSLAVADGRIVALGPDDQVVGLVGPGTVTVDLAGRAVTPGLIDAHSHLGGLGDALAQVDLVGTASYDEVIERVRRAAEGLAPGAWIRGRGWDQNDWVETAFPTHGELSAAVPDHPVWMTRIDGHAALLNARAMAELAIDPTVEDPSGGRYLRDGDGRPTGVLIDRAMDRGGQIPDPPADARRRRLAAAAQRAVSLGLTTVTDMGVGPAEIDTYRAVSAAGELPVRSALFLAPAPPLLAAWARSGPDTDIGDDHLTVRGVKLYADGALGSRGAALVEPYSDDPENTGLLITGSDALRSVADWGLEHGFQIAVHAIGDRGNLVVLDALDAAFGGEPRPAARFRLEHAQVMRLQDIERAARLGIIFSVQPTHATSDMPWAGDRVGERRLDGAYAWRKALDAGGRLALGSDFPVESPDPRLGLYAAVTRQDLDGSPVGGWLPGELLDRQEALRGFTLDAAHSLFLDDELGSLEVGKRADLVVWGGDPLAVPAARIPELPVDLTLVDGEIVHRRDAAASDAPEEAR